MGDIFALFDKIKSQNSAKDSGPVEWVIVGLGNPGLKYDGTRHNMGFLCIDELSRRTGSSVTRAQFKGLCAQTTLADKRVLLVKPQTFMNLSGDCVIEALNWHKISPDHLIIIHDDISLEPGRLRIRVKGSAGGHNGIKDIIRVCGSEFIRIKVGVGTKPNPEYDLADWVLGKIEPKLLGDAISRAADAVECIISESPIKAMDRFNAAKTEAEPEKKEQ